MNSANLAALILWKERLRAKKANENYTQADMYEPAKTYGQMPGEVKLLFDALSDVIEALTEN